MWSGETVRLVTNFGLNYFVLSDNLTHQKALDLPFEVLQNI